MSSRSGSPSRTGGATLATRVTHDTVEQDQSHTQSHTQWQTQLAAAQQVTMQARRDYLAISERVEQEYQSQASGNDSATRAAQALDAAFARLEVAQAAARAPSATHAHEAELVDARHQAQLRFNRVKDAANRVVDRLVMRDPRVRDAAARYYAAQRAESAVHSRFALQEIRQYIGHGVTTTMVRRMLGAQPDDHITVELPSPIAPMFEVHVEGANGSRGAFNLKRLDASEAEDQQLPVGALVMSVPYVHSGQKTTTSGRSLWDGLRAMRDGGVARIKATAARSEHMNGYDTWAKLGATGRIPAQVSAQLPTKYASVTHVEQLMDYPGGAAWWKQHGDSFAATMDLLPGGRTYDILTRFEQRSGARGGARSK